MDFTFLEIKQSEEMKLRSGRIISSTSTSSSSVKAIRLPPVILPFSGTIHNGYSEYCVETIKQLLDAYSLCFSQGDRASVSLSLEKFINIHFDFMASPQFNCTSTFIKTVQDKSIELMSHKPLGYNVAPMYRALSELLAIVEDKYIN